MTHYDDLYAKASIYNYADLLNKSTTHINDFVEAVKEVSNDILAHEDEISQLRHELRMLNKSESETLNVSQERELRRKIRRKTDDLRQVSKNTSLKDVVKKITIELTDIVSQYESQLSSAILIDNISRGSNKKSVQDNGQFSVFIGFDISVPDVTEAPQLAPEIIISSLPLANSILAGMEAMKMNAQLLFGPEDNDVRTELNDAFSKVYEVIRKQVNGRLSNNPELKNRLPMDEVHNVLDDPTHIVVDKKYTIEEVLEKNGIQVKDDLLHYLRTAGKKGYLRTSGLSFVWEYKGKPSVNCLAILLFVVFGSDANWTLLGKIFNSPKVSNGCYRVAETKQPKEKYKKFMEEIFGNDWEAYLEQLIEKYF